MALLSVRVHGTPSPQGSKKAFVVGGKARIVDQNPTGLANWRNAVAEATVTARTEAALETVEVACGLFLRFYMPRPKSAAKRNLPHVKPDLDKLVRATMDALTSAGLYLDDALVVQVYAEKVYAGDDAEQAPGAKIDLYAVGVKQ